jgi:capsular polysaccharide biosynthesis protein
MNAPPREPLWELRKYLGVSIVPKSQRTKIIYVPRRSEWSRNVNNERELLAAIKQAFAHEELVVYRHAELSARDTIQLFEQAKLIIGPHGAGLTNLIFAAPGTPVVELLFSTQPILLYWV